MSSFARLRDNNISFLHCHPVRTPTGMRCSYNPVGIEQTEMSLIRSHVSQVQDTQLAPCGLTFSMHLLHMHSIQTVAQQGIRYSHTGLQNPHYLYMLETTLYIFFLQCATCPTSSLKAYVQYTSYSDFYFTWKLYSKGGHHMTFL